MPPTPPGSAKAPRTGGSTAAHCRGHSRALPGAEPLPDHGGRAAARHAYPCLWRQPRCLPLLAPCPPPQCFTARQRGNSFPPTRAGGRGSCRRSALGRGEDDGGEKRETGRPRCSRGGSGLSFPSAPLGQGRTRGQLPLPPLSLLLPLFTSYTAACLVFQYPSLLFSSLLLRTFSHPLPSPPSFPQVLRNNPPSRAHPLQRVPVGSASPPPLPAPPGLLKPRAVGRVPAGLHIPCPGQAGLGLSIILSAAGSSAPVPLPPRTLPH